MPTPQRSVLRTRIIEWEDGVASPADDYLAVEEPLEIRVCGKPLTVTMRTPGHDRELAAGFLWTEGLIEDYGQIVSIEAVEGAHKGNQIGVELRGGSSEFNGEGRNFIAASGCGVCGKASIEAVRARGLRPVRSEFAIDPEVLCALPGKLRAEQEVFGRTGALHAAALFSGMGELIALREDIGRHNAVDKIVGWALLERQLPLSNCILMVSGRGGFEIAQKAIAAGVPVLASVSAPSSLAVQLARELDLTLVGFLRGRRFVVYAGEDRCVGRRKTVTP
ncbi:MAG TPA: formate dehydrogenase accessory sulfurtransferase FdhD [Terracidiphilus sp.]|nr:formate dehydrogenase accessory sulfurtransferase FdhD [Terracidiphilus sp.]